MTSYTATKGLEKTLFCGQAIRYSFLKRALATLSAAVFCALALAGGAGCAGLEFKPSLKLGEGYESNTYYRRKDEDVKGSFYTLVSPGLGLQMEGSTARAGASYNPEYRHYSSDTGLDYLSHALNASFGLDATKNASFKFDDSFIYTKDSTRASETGIQTLRAGITSNSLKASFEHKTGPTDSVGLKLADSVTDFKDPSSTDARVDEAGAEFKREFAPKSFLSAAYTYRRFFFQPQGSSSVLNNHAVEAGLKAPFSENSAFELTAGALYMAEDSGRYAWTASAAITGKNHELNYDLKLKREVTHAMGLTNEEDISERAGVTFAWALAKDLDAGLYGAASRNRSWPSGAFVITSSDVGVTAGWRARRWIYAGFGYSHFQQWNEGSLGTQFTNDRAFFELTLTPDNWRL